jgi:hypothetical protein
MMPSRNRERLSGDSENLRSTGVEVAKQRKRHNFRFNQAHGFTSAPRPD